MDTLVSPLARRTRLKLEQVLEVEARRRIVSGTADNPVVENIRG